MTNEELIRRVEDVKYEATLLQSEFTSGIVKLLGVVKTLLDGEHFHAVSPVIAALPITEFSDRLKELNAIVASVILDVTTSAAPSPKKTPDAKKVAETTP